jgi:hypothetical protein
MTTTLPPGPAGLSYRAMSESTVCPFAAGRVAERSVRGAPCCVLGAQPVALASTITSQDEDKLPAVIP